MLLKFIPLVVVLLFFFGITELLTEKNTLYYKNKISNVYDDSNVLFDQGDTNDSVDEYTTSRSVRKIVPPDEGIYHGAFAGFGPTEDVVTSEALEHFTSLSQSDLSWGYFSNNWIGGISFPAEEVSLLHDHGVVPFVRMMPRSRFQSSGTDLVYTLQGIINGEFDSDLRQWAIDARESNIPMLVEFGTEVNGNWFAWSGFENGAGVTDEYGNEDIPDGPERFQDAYRHIIDIFIENDVQNVTWVFHVNLISSPNQPWNKPALYYPGDEYIDWIGISAYGAQKPSDRWMLMSELFDTYFEDIRDISDTKPLAVVEFGTVEHSRHKKASWLDDAFDTFLNYSEVRAIAYWHSQWTNEDGTKSNMRIDSSEESLEAYRDATTHVQVAPVKISD